ncbi:phosphate ABC transporter substrate-binding protein PstS [Janibacter cremeus]|uniref:phosphate ABC transporter substrate-binding protein PstS n=1 Tax=Janibacter cremeus TaxID=1285192 RepID=UPI0023FA1A6F|nr:phosphate ABC transporter substrate-binding protein PstS [Janibacter cremeus]WEV77281.1 phosphate ABC transporter substrate-binding protein PstS [Janibacter cremeus]
MLTATAAVAVCFSIASCTPPNERSSGGGGVSGSLSGAGSSAQAAAVDAWKQGFLRANPDATVNYDPIGSGGGREQFASGAVPWAGSDAYLADEELAAAQERCGGKGNLIEIPAYISPIALPYNIPGVDDLQLSPETMAKIFNQKITTWNHEAIAKENPDADLPSTPITVVNRSDESGTTENFVDYLSVAANDAWPHEVSGNWPVSGGTAAKGNTGVVQSIEAADGSIGYADVSQIGDLDAAKVQVGEDWVEPSPEAAAKILDASTQVDGRGQFDYATEIERETTEAGTYPIVLASYELACTQYEDAETAALVQAWLSYVVSEEGQQASAETAGSAPISDDTRAKANAAIEAISAQ